MGGDAQDYYSSLVSVFIQHDLQEQQSDAWYLLHTHSGVINVHPVGVALLQLPFFIVARLLAGPLGFAVDGYSLPFQLAVAAAALFYAMIGLLCLRRLCMLRGVSDTIAAITILLLFFGTNLLHYTVSEAGMSHVYSFSLISAFLYFSASLVKEGRNRDLLLCGLLTGLILLVRPNNVFALLFVLLWFRSWKEFFNFSRVMLRKKQTWLAVGLAAFVVFIQPLVWYMQTGQLFHDTYKRDGFYWTRPQLAEMLFGFDNGFFIYTPVCLLLLLGLISLFRANRFAGTAAILILGGLMYFFSAYWAYNYFDGFGIRVLVDYYSVFGFLGAELLGAVKGKLLLQGTAMSAAALLLLLNLVYTYQANAGILLRSGMNYNMWRYVFLKTSGRYRHVLGGSHEMKPFRSTEAPLMSEVALDLQQPYDYSGKEYGPSANNIVLYHKTNRVRLELDLERREKSLGASDQALVVMAVESPGPEKKTKTSLNFKLNETPATDCCESKSYHYTVNLVGDFDKGDKLTVFLYNTGQKDFYLEKMALRLYDFNYSLN